MDLSAFPERIPAPPASGRDGAGSALSYVLDRRRVAVREDASSVEAGPGVSIGPDLTVLPADSLPGDSEADVLPVYGLGAGGAPFVPTGTVGLRFREGVSAWDRQDGLHQVGYRILDVPAYAPHFAWIEARSGRLVDTLAGLHELQEIPDVAHVEVQMITPKATR